MTFTTFVLKLLNCNQKTTYYCLWPWYVFDICSVSAFFCRPTVPGEVANKKWLDMCRQHGQGFQKKGFLELIFGLKTGFAEPIFAKMCIPGVYKINQKSGKIQDFGLEIHDF